MTTITSKKIANTVSVKNDTGLMASLELAKVMAEQSEAQQHEIVIGLVELCNHDEMTPAIKRKIRMLAKKLNNGQALPIIGKGKKGAALNAKDNRARADKKVEAVKKPATKKTPVKKPAVTKAPAKTEAKKPVEKKTVAKKPATKKTPKVEVTGFVADIVKVSDAGKKLPKTFERKTLKTMRNVNPGVEGKGVMYAIVGGKRTRMMVWSTTNPVTKEVRKVPSWFFTSKRAASLYN